MYCMYFMHMQLQCSVYPSLQRLTAELQQSSSERARMLVEADDLRHRVEQQGRRLKEAEAEKAALEAQLGSSTGQLRQAREKATETIKRCVHTYVRTYVHCGCMDAGKVYVYVGQQLSLLCIHL